jgi:surfeit locus 1 family protein
MTKSFTFQCRQRSYLFTFKAGFSLLCVVFFTLFCVLGVWQLQRYHYKKSLLSLYDARLTAHPEPFQQVKNSTEDLQFQRVTTQGQYLNGSTVLLQNQFKHDQVGFDVLTPLKMEGDETLLLVDRGWVTKNDAESLAKIDKDQQVAGYLKKVNEYQFMLGKNILNENVAPIVAQKIDTNELSRIMHKKFYPYVLRLDQTQANGFERDWVIVTAVPERHMGYAIQGFVMAFVLFIAYLCFCCERVKNEK